MVSDMPLLEEADACSCSNPLSNSRAASLKIACSSCCWADTAERLSILSAASLEEDERESIMRGDVVS